MKSFYCPSCRSPISSDDPPGTAIDCPSCGAGFAVPALPVVKPLKTPPPGPGGSGAAPPQAVTPAAQAKRLPTVQPVRPPVAQPAPAQPSAARPARPRRPAAPEPRGARKPVALWAGIGGVLVVGILAVISTRGGDGDAGPAPGPGPGPTAGSSPPESGGGPASGTAGAAGATAPSGPEDAEYREAAARAKDAQDAGPIAAFAELAAARAATAAAIGDAAAARRHRDDERAAWRSVLEKDPAHARAQEGLGEVLVDLASARAWLSAAWMTQADRTDLEVAIDDLQGGALKGRGAKAWLPAGHPDAKDWAKLLGRLDVLRRAEEAKAGDPFYADAESMGRRLVREFSEVTPRIDFHRKGVEGDAFTLHLHKPYIVLVQREATGGEEQIAQDWCTVLDALLVTFYERFGKACGLSPMEKPTPVFILRDSEAYTKYLRIDYTGSGAVPAVNSGAHFEPWSNRLVCYITGSDGDRTTLFHEGTHQIVEFAMKTAGTRRGMKQSLWFSEGIADFMGGHSREFDRESSRYVYEPGLINLERVTQLVGAKQAGSLFPLAELLEYSRAHFHHDQKDPQKAVRTLNGYIQGWGLTFFLNNWQDGKYRKDFIEYLKEEFAGNSGKAAFSKVFGRYGLEALEQEFLDMVDDLRAAVRDKRIVNGRLLPEKPK